MSSDRHARFRDRYNRQVKQLRSKIDSLPEEARPHLHALLDEKDRACRLLQETAQSTCNFTDDLSLAATRAAFHLEATWREVKESG